MNENIIILGGSNCVHSYQINDCHVPQCDKCLNLINWKDLRKILNNTYGDQGELDYDRLKYTSLKSRKKPNSNLTLVKKVYYSVELDKEYVRYFYYENTRE